jgi:hypothetical protein
MSDYTKSTDFASKDALPSGNAGKIVKGTEIDTEFNNIATAIATKADLASPSLTGSPTAPTQSSGDSSTKLATTAFVAAAITSGIAAAYPVGSIYINATNSTNPATLLGFGTWTAFGAGRVMVGFNASDPLFDTAEETGGSKDAVVVTHTHSASTSISDPGHRHTEMYNNGGSPRAMVSNTGDGSSTAGNVPAAGGNTTSNALLTESSNTGISASTSVSSTGSSGTNANLQPYITVYMWKRTA